LSIDEQDEAIVGSDSDGHRRGDTCKVEGAAEVQHHRPAFRVRGAMADPAVIDRLRPCGCRHCKREHQTEDFHFVFAGLLVLATA